MTAESRPIRHWWLDWRIVLKFTPLYLGLVAAAVLARFRGSRRARGAKPFRPGLSVLIPERGTPDLLAESLAAVSIALGRVGEPIQLLVVVNGAAKADYAALENQFPQVEWLHFSEPLGYNGAIAAGLRKVRHPWTYLLNSDMRLEPDALIELLGYRQDHVFAATSQIFFTNPARRREETGWSDFVWNPNDAQVYERQPEDSEVARGNLYPGGGSSLCRTDLLRRYVRGSRHYSPFYWEDADWGVRAWIDGWEVVFVPRSRAWHQHRGTVNRYYKPDEVDRIIRRNALLFDLRHGWTALRPGQLMHKIRALDVRSQSELVGLGIALGAFACRLAARRARRRGLDFPTLASNKFYSARPPVTQRRPRVLLVSPFAVFPPAHGGARRIAELVQRLSPQVDFILLGDERSLYTAQAYPWFAHFRAVHLVEGRGDIKGEAPMSLLERIARHRHPKLIAELQRLIAVYDPDIIQFEFMELAALAADRQGRARRILSLHDVYLSRRPEESQSDAGQDALLAPLDALTVCSSEDAALLRHRQVDLIPNGAANRMAGYLPSPQLPNLLFMGPLRYAPNRIAIVSFLDRVWPSLRARIPTLTLTILGGVEASEATADDPRFSQPGVELIARFVDPEAYLARATLTINPQLEIRGSALKLIESLLAGRICVSTVDGARGFHEATLPGLLQVAALDDMIEPILSLLGDAEHRHALERDLGDAATQFGWDAIAQRQLKLYRKLLAS